MSVSDLAAAVGVNRNTVSRYLDVLLVSGRVEMETYGKAKVFYLSQRVPIAAMLNFSSDLVLVLDRDRRIVQANDAVCSFAGRERDDIIGNSIETSPLAAFDHPLIRSRITDALGGREVTEELRFLRHDEEIFFRIKFLPTVFNDGTPGVTIILDEITESRRAEEALAVYAEWMRWNSRSIYGCTMAEPDLEVPADCRLTQSADGRRLYVHLFAYPFKHLHLPGLADRVDYAQFLHDGSELPLHVGKAANLSINYEKPEDGLLILDLPVRKPDVVVPVVELFLK